MFILFLLYIEPVRKSHEKTKSNKRKSKRDVITPSEIENTNVRAFQTSKNHKKHEEYEDNEIIFKEKNESYTPRSWKDSWKRPLNQNMVADEYDSSTKIRTDKISRRQNSRKNAYEVDLLSMDY